MQLYGREVRCKLTGKRESSLKKGALSDCSNWRSITLLSVPSKLHAKIIIKRTSDALDSGFGKEQAGFRRERGCTDEIFTLRNIS